MRLVQLELEDGKRGLAAVDGPSLQLLEGVESTLNLAREAYARGMRIAECAERYLSQRKLSYRNAVENKSLLPQKAFTLDPGSIFQVLCISMESPEKFILHKWS